jgi:hypothetical protein
VSNEIAAHPAGARNDGPLGEVAGQLRCSGKSGRGKWQRGSFAAVAKVATGSLRDSGKSGRKIVAGVARLLRSSGKAAVPQWQKWQGRGAAVGEVKEVREVGAVCRGAASGYRASNMNLGIGNLEVCFVGLAENRAGQIINSL